MDKTVQIYALVDPRTDEIRYVGKTSRSLKARLKQHMNERARHHRAAWLRGLKSEGIVPEVIHLEAVPPDEDWIEAEQFWIAYIRFLGFRLVNRTEGGEGVSGLRHTSASRKQMSQKHRGKKLTEEHRAHIGAALLEFAREHPGRLATRKPGYQHSMETRKKLREHLAGVVADPEVREKIAASKRGKHLSKEHKSKIAIAHRGKTLSEEHKAAIGATIRELGIKPPSQKGKTFSTEHRRKIAEAQKGKIITPEQRAKISATKRRAYDCTLIDKVQEMAEAEMSNRAIARETGLTRYEVATIINEGYSRAKEPT